MIPICQASYPSLSGRLSSVSVKIERPTVQYIHKREHIETIIAKNIILDKIKVNSTITIDYTNNQLIIKDLN